MTPSGFVERVVTTPIGDISIVSRAAGKGAPMVLWPSIFYDRSLYDEIAPLLTSPLVLIDGPGHGRSSLSVPKVTMADCAAVIRSVCDALGIDAAIIGGTPWGGVVAVEYGLFHPERTIALVLLNVPFDMPARTRLSTRAIVAATRWTPTLGFFKRGVARSFFSPATLRDRQDVVERFLAQPETFRNPGLHRAVRAVLVLIERESLLPRLPGVRRPTLVAAGQDDGLYAVEELKAAADAIPGAQFEVISQAGHIAAAERPQHVARLLNAFVARV